MKQSHLRRLGIVVLLAGSISFAGGLPNRVLSQDDSLEAITLVNVDRLEPISPLWQPEDVGMPGAGITLASVDGNLLLLGNYLPVQVRVLDIERMEFGEVISFPNAQFLYYSALNASDGYAAVHDERSFYLANLSSLEVELLQSLEPFGQDSIGQPIFSPSGTILAYTMFNLETESSSDGLYLYDYSLKEQTAFVSYPGISTFDIREDGLQYVLAGVNGEVALWDATTDEISVLRQSDEKLIGYIAYLNPTSLVLRSNDGSSNRVEVWNIETRQQLSTQMRGRIEFYLGDSIAGMRDLSNNVQLWNLRDDQNMARLENVQIHEVNLQNNLLITSTDSDFDFRRLDTGEIMYSMSVPDLSDALLTADNRRMVFWNIDGNIQVWGIPAT